MAAQSTAPVLPYGPALTRILRPLQRAFVVVNRGLVGPMLRSPLWPLVGNPATAHHLLLRTRGRRSGKVREAPLGYVIRDGSVYVVAGYGAATPWFRNLVDAPAVEVALPGRRFRGIAEPVTDGTEWLAAYRALIRSFGLVGRLVGGVEALEDPALLATHRSLPVVRIRAVEPAGPIRAGAWDPGGRGWLIAYALAGGAIGLVTSLLRRNTTPRIPTR